MRDVWREINSFLGRYLSPAVRWIFMANVLVFLFFALFSFSTTGRLLFNLMAERPFLAVRHFYVWQFFTYMFLHDGVSHLLFNMMVLWFFAPRIEYRWGTRAFLQFFFTVGIGAGIFHALFAYASSQITGRDFTMDPMIGSSGAIYGVMLAYALYYPDDTVLLYFVLPIKIKYLMIVLGVATFLFSMNAGGSNISHDTHLGGLLIALLYLKGGGWLNWQRWFQAKPKAKVRQVDPRRHPDYR